MIRMHRMVGLNILKYYSSIIINIITSICFKCVFFRGATAGAGKVSLEKISWFMPHVIPADAEKFNIYKTIESNAKLPVAYTM